MAAHLVSRAQNNTAFNPTVIVQGTVYFYLGALSPPQHMKDSYVSVYFSELNKMKRATTR